MSVRTKAGLPDPAELGRLLSRLENDPAARATILAVLPPVTRPAQRIGITGSPGVGKSTLLAGLIPLLQGGDKRAGLLAVDPSSALSGGAVLADRFRWGELSATGAFIRSFASRGSLGGVAPGLAAATTLLESAGYDPIVIETVGAGQTGFEVRGLADTVVVLLSPESGDGLQLLKAGLLEVGDIFCINKADRPGAAALRADLRGALEQAREVALGQADDWTQPVLMLSALRGEGTAALAEQIAAHWQWLTALPAQHPRRLRRVRSELDSMLRAMLDAAFHGAQPRSSPLAAAVQSGEMSMQQAQDQLLAELRRIISTMP